MWPLTSCLLHHRQMALLYLKELFLRTQHIMPFHCINVKQNRLRPILKKGNSKCTNVSSCRFMWTCPVCNHMEFPLTRSTSPHEWNYKYVFTGTWQTYYILCRSRIQPSLLGEDGRSNMREWQKSTQQGTSLTKYGTCNWTLTKVSLLTMITSFAPALFAIRPFVNNVQFPLCIATAAPCISEGFSGCSHRTEGLASTREYLGW